jgi:hypothetical protein
MHAGQLKFFNNLTNLYSELRTYRRDENGKIVKDRDHLLDALRYAIQSGREQMVTKPKPSTEDFRPQYYCPGDRTFVWMQ